MKLLVVVGCVLISSVLAAPQHGDFSSDSQDSVLQEPSGFVAQGGSSSSSSEGGHSSSRQGSSSSFSQSGGGGSNGVTIVRYVYDFRGVDGYKFTLVSSSNYDKIQKKVRYSTRISEISQRFTTNIKLCHVTTVSKKDWRTDKICKR